MSITAKSHFYSIVIAIHSPEPAESSEEPIDDWRLGEINVDWVDFTREKSIDMPPEAPASSTSTTSPAAGPSSSSSRRKGPTQKPVPGSSATAAASTSTTSKKKPSSTDPDALSLQPLLAHFPGPNPLDSSVAQGVSAVGRGVVHLFRHAPPAHLIASLDGHPVGEGSGSGSRSAERPRSVSKDEWSGDRAEGEDGSLIAILAVPAWMRPADFLEFIGGWSTCLEGVRMIREATTPNRSIVLLKFRDPLQASDFLVIFTGRAFSTLDARETCHPIRIHHLVLHKLDKPDTSGATVSVPAFPPSVYASRVKALPELLTGVPNSSKFELPSCPVCLERLDSTVTGLVTLPCAHTFDCDCLKKWGDSRCPVCRVSHLLLSSAQNHVASTSQRNGQVTRATKCATCDSTENNWICVVCGVVGCGRYDPGKGHARRHWEESGHVLAMELETQRVWDYKGDNYVHRLIQTRTDGKLVELPSASSLVTSLARPLPLNDNPQAPPQRQRLNTNRDSTAHSTPTNQNGSSSEAGPSSNDIDKMSTIEAITLEYSYLLSSQLEAMRQHYEAQQTDLQTRLTALEAQTADVLRTNGQLDAAQREKEKADRKARQAVELSRNLQTSLSAERAMTQGLSERIKVLEEDKGKRDAERRELEQEKNGLEETVRDLMFSLDASTKIQQLGGEGGEGGDLVVKGRDKPTPKGKKGKK